MLPTDDETQKLFEKIEQALAALHVHIPPDHMALSTGKGGQWVIQILGIVHPDAFASDTSEEFDAIIRNDLAHERQRKEDDLKSIDFDAIKRKLKGQDV